MNERAALQVHMAQWVRRAANTCSLVATGRQLFLAIVSSLFGVHLPPRCFDERGKTQPS